MSDPNKNPGEGKKKNHGAQNGAKQMYDALGMHGKTNALLIIEDEKIIYASPAYINMMGYAEKEYKAMDQEDIQSNIHPDDKEDVNRIVSDSLRLQKPEAYYRFREKTNSGQYILREDYARFQYDDQGNHIRTYVVCRDISEEDTQENTVKRQNIKVLIAEDNRMNMMLTQELLLDMDPGIHIIEAWNGKEAVEQFRKELPDIVLMDVNMPEKDGYQASKEIRQAEKEKNLSRRPIIAITARTHKGEKQRCLDADMDEYLPKPVQETDFVNTVNTFLMRMQVTKQAHKKKQ